MTEEMQSLMQRAERYLESAQLLLNADDYESCISRVYYAMFYAAEAALLTKNVSYSSHRGVISGFGEHFIKTEIFPRELGREFNKAYEKRQLSDYEYRCVISVDEAKEMIEKGTAFIAHVEEYLDECKN